MKDNRISVIINKPIEEVFEFTTNPKNTPLWIEDIIAEKTNGWPIKLGSIYKNQNKKGEWREFIVSAFAQNKLFELTSKDNNYHVRYSYKDLGNTCELEYYEWADNGDLKDFLTQEVLQGLKDVIENSLS